MNITDVFNSINPDDLRFLLQQYNIADEPSEEAIAKAIQMYGEDFITDLYILLNYSANAEGDLGPSLPEGSFTTDEFKKNTGFDWSNNKPKKGINWSKINSGLSSFAASLKGGVKNYADSKLAFANNANQGIPTQQPQDNTWKWALGIGAGLILILVLFVVLRKKSS